MAEPTSSLTKAMAEKDFTESVMEAAQQLMQLSGDNDEEEDGESANTTNHDNNNNNNRIDNEEREREQSPSEITSMIDEEAWRPKKQRYRSVVDIYMTTKPIYVCYGHKRKY